MSTAAVVRRLSDEVFMKGNLGAFDELVSSSVVSHDPQPGVAPTRVGLRDLARLVTTAFSKRAFEYDEIAPLADGRVVENWAMTAAHVGELFALPLPASPYACAGWKSGAARTAGSSSTGARSTHGPGVRAPRQLPRVEPRAVPKVTHSGGA